MNDQKSNLVANLSHYFPKLSEQVHKKTEFLSQSINQALVSTANKIGQYKTNLVFSIKHSPLSRKQIQIKEGGPNAQLLGQEYSAEQAHMFLFVFRTTFWFTYRKGIKDIETDNGWGCMIRAVQMLFAEILKRHLRIKDTQSDQYQVIRYFNQQNEGVLSLSAICQEGNIKKRWTSNQQVFICFSKIMARHPNYFTFQFDTFYGKIPFKNQKEVLFKKYPAVVSLNNRVSLEEIPQELHAHYLAMMKHHTWVGTIGGVKGQALYIIGSYEDRVIFLDPHFVQNTQEQLEVESFFCRTPRGISLKALSPSLSFCYYFASEKEHLDWIKWMSTCCENHYPDLVFQFMEESIKKKLDKKVKKIEVIPHFEEDKVLEKGKEEELLNMQLQIISAPMEDSGQFQVLQ